MRLSNLRSAKLRAPVLLAFLVVCNAAVALVMTWCIVTTIGLNPQTDAYFASAALPQIAFLILSSTILPVLVPFLAKRSETEMLRGAWTFLIAIVGLSTTLAILIGASADLWVPMVFRGFSRDVASLAIELIRIQTISMVLNAAIVSLWLLEQARGRFIRIEATGLAANLVGLLVLFFTLQRFGIRAAAWNVVFFNCLKFAMLVPALRVHTGSKWHPGTLREAWSLLRPFLPGQAYLRSEPLIDRPLATIWGVGGLSLLYIAQQIYGNGAILVGKVLVAPVMPGLAIESSEGNFHQFRRGYRRTIAFVLCLALTGAFIFAATGMPVLRSLIGHGGITEANVETLFLVMLSLSGAFAGNIATQVTAGAFYAKGDTIKPTKVAVGIFTVYLPIKVMVFLHYGLVGLALTISAYQISVFLIQLLLLERELRRRSHSDLDPALPIATPEKDYFANT